MFRTQEKTLLDQTIDNALLDLNRHEISSDEYAKILERVIMLSQLRKGEKSSPLSKDTLATVGANLLGILMIIKHEHVNVVTSRAMNLLLKPVIRA